MLQVPVKEEDLEKEGKEGEEQGAQEAFSKAKEAAEADHLQPGWSFQLLDTGLATPDSWKGEGSPPPSPGSQAPPSPALPGPSTLLAPTSPLAAPPPSPGSPAPSSTLLTGPNTLPAPSTPLAAPGLAPQGTPTEVVPLEGSEEETAQLPSLKRLPRATTQSNWGSKWFLKVACFCLGGTHTHLYFESMPSWLPMGIQYQSHTGPMQAQYRSHRGTLQTL